MTFRYQIKGELCDEQTRKDLKRYWESREIDLEMLYDYWDKSNEEIAKWLTDEEGYDLDSPEDFNTEDDYRDYLIEQLYEARSNYGLGIDVVEPCTFKDQPEMYLRYQFSWGGGQDEIRFIFDLNGYLERVEYWYLNWGTGCYIDITDLPLTDQIWEDLKEIFYEQINEAIDHVANSGCDAYMDCYPEYIPEECKEGDIEDVKFYYSGDIDLNGRYIGNIDSDGDFSLEEDCPFTEDELREELLRQMEEYVEPEDWSEEWIRAVGKENLPRDLLQRYLDKWGITYARYRHS